MAAVVWMEDILPPSPLPPSLPPSLPLLGVPKKQTFMPELLHNIELLVSQTEQDIIQTERKLRYNRDLIVNLSHEKEERMVQQVELDQQVDKLSEILGTINM